MSNTVRRIREIRSPHGSANTGTGRRAAIARSLRAALSLATLLAALLAAEARAASIEARTCVNARSCPGTDPAPWQQTSTASFGTVTLDSGWITGGPPNSGMEDATSRAAAQAAYGRLGVDAETTSNQYGGATAIAKFSDTWTLVPTDPARVGQPGYLYTYVTVSGSWRNGYVKIGAPGGEQFAGNPYVPSGSYAGTLVFEKYVSRLGDPIPVSFVMTGTVSPAPDALEHPSFVDYLHTAELTNVRLWQGGFVDFRMTSESGFSYGFGVIPEPSTLSLLGSSLLALALGRRRRVSPSAVQETVPAMKA